MAKRGFEERLRAIDALRRAGDPAAAEPELRKALNDKRSNFTVKKAAVAAGELGLASLIPDLLAAYERLFDDAVKSDPQCWGKTAIAVALKDLGYDEPEPFYRGLGHVQFEPVWGGQEDSAGALRAACVAALPGCRADAFDLLARLSDALADPDRGVRAEAALTIAHLGHEAGAGPLRLKARVGDVEPEVLGACLSALLTLDVFDPVAFVAGFLDSREEETRGEACSALAAANQPEAFTQLESYWKREPTARRPIALSLAASPREEAVRIWREAIGREPAPVAEAALEAFSSSRFRDKFADDIEASVRRRDSQSITQTWRKLQSGA